MAATKAPKIKVKPVDKNTWKDFEAFFESKGAPSWCWCMVWRMTNEELKHNHSPDRKEYLRKRVTAKTPIGLLGYIGTEPVAWCSVAPRASHLRLGGDDRLEDEDVWSITCFFVKKEYREQRLVPQLIEHARKYARKHGAKYMEAYPVKPSSPSYRFMGFTKTFEKADFEFVKKAGSRRSVMVRKA
ncbi:GNAT family N-acetyltransferase [Dawidia soli]|uniref:GNAT family N-acetyltransferase n=1 Tax=Dawidia soli TaxID=2782352 RepID=A0AAP2D8B0_9BACT|nr:GNAT family N-acetyltransferase [Dawidia soli]MBT1686822.1 GNAT family N-acetyltransferase [Dawidia soli]